MAERRPVEPRPKPEPIGRDDQQPPFARQHAPTFPQHGVRPFRQLQRMDMKNLLIALYRWMCSSPYPFSDNSPKSCVSSCCCDLKLYQKKKNK
ncbi:MAG: hypothetical protein AAF684_01005, partial [Pseudomonadota bacterium]